MSLILKNTTIENQTWGGELIAASSQRPIQIIEYTRLLIDEDFLTALESGDAVVNDGGADVSSSGAISRLSRLISVVNSDGSINVEGISSIKFEGNFSVEPLENGRVKVKTGGGPLIPGANFFSFLFSRDGNVEDDWLRVGNDGSIISQETPLVMPFPALLRGITFSNKKIGADLILEIYVVRRDAITYADEVLLLTWNATSARMGVMNDFGGVEYNFDMGDRIAIFSRKTGGDTMDDLVVHLYFQMYEYTPCTQTCDLDGKFAS